MAKIVGTKLIIDGFIYIKSRKRNGRTYWDCQKLRAGVCNARAVTTTAAVGNALNVESGPSTSKHDHPPNQEQTKAEMFVQELKRKAEEHPEQPPRQLIRNELLGVPSGVLSQLPLREALRKTVRRVRTKNLPPNPRSMTDLQDLPAEYKRTLQDEPFLLHDNRGTPGEGRVLVFATRKNIEVLCRSTIWFVDGTFDVTPTIFTQLFTIIGIRQRNHTHGEDTPLPFVYAFLEGKQENQYAAVLRAVRQAVARYRVNACTPLKIMSDFELGILNACRDVFPGIPVTCCFFHLAQAVYRHVQGEGLQGRYNDPDDRSIKIYTHMLLALAYVPEPEVVRVYEDLLEDAPAEIKPVYHYFDRTYVRGVPARGRRRAVLPRYAPTTWNQYDAVLANSHKTNNVSEGWHNRFRVMMGKHHPDLYSALAELKKEQGNTESCLAELSLGRRVKNSPGRKWLNLQDRIYTIVLDFDDHVIDSTELDYLRLLADTILLS